MHLLSLNQYSLIKSPNYFDFQYLALPMRSQLLIPVVIVNLQLLPNLLPIIPIINPFLSHFHNHRLHLGLHPNFLRNYYCLLPNLKITPHFRQLEVLVATIQAIRVEFINLQLQFITPTIIGVVSKKKMHEYLLRGLSSSKRS